MSTIITRILLSVTGKGKVYPRTDLEGPKGGVNVLLHSFSTFTLGARWQWVVSATTRLFYPRARSGTHCIGGWVGPQGRSGRVRKISPPPDFDLRTVQPVASRCCM